MADQTKNEPKTNDNPPQPSAPQPQFGGVPSKPLRCPRCSADRFDRIEMGKIVDGKFVHEDDEYRCAGVCGARGPLRDFQRG